MSALYNRSLARAVGVFLAGAVLLGTAAPAFAGHDPKIKVRDVKRDRVDLRVKNSKFEDKRVVVRVFATNLSTGAMFTRDFKVKLSDDEGKRTVKISGLKPETRYSFKVRVARRSGDDAGKFREFSNTEKATTKR